MGSEGGDSYESPAHEETVRPFYMDRTEVTNEQYAEFVKATNHVVPLDWKEGSYPEGAAKLPVVQVSWQDANDYALWVGKRLPTEAEWEFAARTQDGRRYPWGSDWDGTKANTSESALNQPIAVGSYPNAANPYGLLDMAGNVWEWTADEVMSYQDASVALAPGKVIRGGAFYRKKDRATTTFRGFAPPGKPSVGIGFRCVKDAK
jgi:formylglycine-generating enzyme required for sulfatase activity